MTNLLLLLLRGVCLVLLTIGLGTCGAGGGDGGESPSGLVYNDPTWISASWGGGAQGAPLDYRSIEATDWNGLLCPATALQITYDGNTIHFVNNCTETITFGMCSTKGSLDGPYVCSTDPMNTDADRIKQIPLNPGQAGWHENASINPSIEVFLCSSSDQLVASPVRCMGTR